MIHLAKLALAVVCVVAGMVASSSRRLRELSDARFGAVAIGFGVASRFALFVLVFIVLRFEVRSDLPAYYYPQAKSALLGQLVYRDFDSSYAPLFPYIAALAVGIWNSPKALVLLAIVLEALSLPLWLRSARAVFDEGTARLAMVLYLTSAVPLVNVALQGQNQIYCAFLLSASFALLVARRPFLSGLVAGSAAVAVKFIGVLPAVGPFIGATDRRVRWLAGGALLPVLVYGLFITCGADVLMPVRLEAGQRSSGNLPFILTALDAGAPTGSSLKSMVAIAFLALSLLAVLLWALRGGPMEPQGALYVITIVLMTFMIVSKKAYTQYLVLAFFPLAATVAARASGRRGVLAFNLFGAIAMLEPGLWFAWLQPGDFSVLWQPGAASRGRVVVLLVCDLLLVGGYATLWWQAFRALTELRRAPRAALPPGPESVRVGA